MEPQTMGMPAQASSKTARFFSHIATQWVILTAVYLALFLAELSEKVTLFIGLFVPFGFFNTIASWGMKGLITFPLLAIALYAGHVGGKKIPSVWLRTVFNLGILLVLTFLVDSILWGGWCSADNLFDLDIVVCSLGI